MSSTTLLRRATLTCDQAIFTSIRATMSEGYRIVAASRGLQTDEKQVITRSSPSHDALCWQADTADNAYGAAFYPLPSGRLCVARSCYAGAEHTGRGGQRVYTHNLIFDQRQFPQCTYNPFNVLRAMVDADLASPQLKPPSLLPVLKLPITNAAFGEANEAGRDNGRAESERVTSLVQGGAGESVLGPDLWKKLDTAWRGYVLSALLNDRTLVVNLPNGWVEVAEAILMGVPGPMRTEVSFSAGLRFSIGRCHRLSLFHDENRATRSRTFGRGVEYLDPTATDEPPARPTQERSHPPLTRPLEGGDWEGDTRTSAWHSFVERHWDKGDVVTLARRTSQAFSDVSAASRERVGLLYNEIDAIAQTDTTELLGMAATHLIESKRDVETDIAAELVVTAHRTLMERLDGMSWDEACRHWTTICAIPRQSTEAGLFVQPLIEQALRVAGRKHPAVAAEAALLPAQFLRASGPTTHPPESAVILNTVLDGVLTRFAEWVENATDAELMDLRETEYGIESLISRWRGLKPNCPIVQRLRQRRTDMAPTPSRW